MLVVPTPGRDNQMPRSGIKFTIHRLCSLPKRKEMSSTLILMTRNQLEITTLAVDSSSTSTKMKTPSTTKKTCPSCSIEALNSRRGWKRPSQRMYGHSFMEPMRFRRDMCLHSYSKHQQEARKMLGTRMTLHEWRICILWRSKMPLINRDR